MVVLLSIGIILNSPCLISELMLNRYVPRSCTYVVKSLRLAKERGSKVHQLDRSYHPEELN
jgi:hypothetical protein